ncbi:MAG: PD40 domain-containing protein [Acidobacteria bacterium]|nr:PD40 domain-containing protein [Acidobacteriota bacterium]
MERLRFGEPEVELADRGRAVHFSEVGTGTLVYYDKEPATNKVVWIDRHGEMTTALELGSKRCTNLDLSGDGEKLLLACYENDRHVIYLAHLQRRMITRLLLEGNAQTPIWHPGEQTITYSSNREEGWGIYQVSYDGLDGFGDPELLLERPNPVYPQVWSPDGTWLAFQETHAETNDDIWLLPVDPPGEPIPFATTAAEERVATLVSPDGRWLGYATNASGNFHTYLASVPGAEVRKKISSLPGGWNVWVPQRQEVLYMTEAGQTLLSVKFPDGPGGEPATPHILFDLNNKLRRVTLGMVFDVAPDGERIISVVRVPPTASRLNIVVNWFEELKKRVPTGEP